MLGPIVWLLRCVPISVLLSLQMNPAEAGVAKKQQERETLRNVIAQWNANRLDLFELSEPNEVSLDRLDETRNRVVICPSELRYSSAARALWRQQNFRSWIFGTNYFRNGMPEAAVVTEINF